MITDERGEKHFERRDYKPLKKAYDEAVATGKDTFIYEDAVVITQYAKYVIEYMEMSVKN